MSSTKICVACGKKFEPRNSRQMTCLSPECQRVRKSQIAEKYSRRFKKRKCCFCGKKFRPKRLKQKYCCVECAGHAMQKPVKPEGIQYTNTQCHFNDITHHPGCTGPADYNFCPLW